MFFYDQWVSAGVFVLAVTALLTLTVAALEIFAETGDE